MLCFLFTQPLFAQEAGTEVSTEVTEEKKVFKKDQVLKWNPASIYAGKISLHGEFNLKPKRSITVGLGIPVDHKEVFTLNDDEQHVTTQTISLMAGYRMYLGKKSTSGLYFEPYLKFLKNDLESFIFTELDGDPVIMRATSEYTGFGAGAQLGVQFLIAKRVVIDFFFLGPEANTAKVAVLARDITSSSWNPQDVADARDAIEDIVRDIPLIGDNVKVNVDASSKRVTADYKGFLPGFRAGLSVGVRF